METTDAVATTPIMCNYKLLGDNLDLGVKTRFTRMEDHRNESLDFFHCCAVKDRVDFSHLPFRQRYTCFNSTEKMAKELLPSVKCDTELLSNITILVSRIIVEYMPIFNFALSDVVTWHLKHEYYTEMSSKSEVVCIITIYVCL